MNKGKNTVHLFMEGALLDLLHKSEPKMPDNNNQNCFIPLLSLEETLACTDFDKCLMQDTVGNNVLPSALISDKYSLEMNTICKGDRLRLARGAIQNRIPKQKQIVNKGKNTVHLFTEGTLPDLLQESEPKILDNNNQNCLKPLLTSEETLAYTDFDKCLIQDTVGDNVLFSG